MRPATFSRPGALALVAVLWTAIGCSRPAPVTVTAFAAILDVLANGDLQGDETITVRLPEGRPSAFTRVVPREYADDLTLESALVDGQSVAHTASFGRGGLRIEVPFDAAGTRDRVITLRYTASGTVAVSGVRGHLRWPWLTSGRGYEVAHASLRVRPPAGSLFLSLPGIAEPDWNVQLDGGGVMAERALVTDRESATAMAEFGIERARIVEPVWQIRGQLANELIPAFVSAGLFFLVTGAGVVWIVRFQFPRIPREQRYTDAGRRAAADVERRTAASGLAKAALVCVISAAAIAGIIEWLMPQFGVWAHAIPVSIFLVGLMLFAQSRRL